MSRITPYLRHLTAPLLLMLLAFQGIASAQSADPKAALLSLYERLEIAPLPNKIAADANVARYLNVLLREPCDWDAVYPLAGALQRLNYKREAARVYLSHSRKCRSSNVALSRAADILYGLSDFDAAATVADELIADSPDLPQFHYLRGQILDGAKRYEEAVDAYETTIALANDISRINGGVFQDLSASYAALGKYCDAITSLQRWIAINPERNDNPQVRSIIKRYKNSGECPVAYAEAKGKFRAKSNGGVILVKATINGVTGNFVVDTGASLLSVTKDFARRAKLTALETSTVRLQTANGVIEARRAVADKVALGDVSASNVGAVVFADDESSLGKGLDGLLGQSFLSRFHIVLTQKELLVEAKSD